MKENKERAIEKFLIFQFDTDYAAQYVRTDCQISSHQKTTLLIPLTDVGICLHTHTHTHTHTRAGILNHVYNLIITSKQMQLVLLFFLHLQEIHYGRLHIMAPESISYPLCSF